MRAPLSRPPFRATASRAGRSPKLTGLLVNDQVPVHACSEDMPGDCDTDSAFKFRLGSAVEHETVATSKRILFSAVFNPLVFKSRSLQMVTEEPSSTSFAFGRSGCRNSHREPG